LVARELAIAASGLTPLAYMLAIMRDEAQPVAVRLDMAKAAAPYVHPRLAAVEQSGKNGESLPQSIQITFVSPNHARKQASGEHQESITHPLELGSTRVKH
jgi:hypothetical protein